jgi:hypothetical protein
VRLKELGIQVEREWWIDDEGRAYVVDLAKNACKSRHVPASQVHAVLGGFIVQTLHPK